MGVSLLALLISLAISVVAIWLAIQVFVKFTKKIDE